MTNQANHKNHPATPPREAQEAGWRPIATAPQDGTSYLAASAASSVFLAHYANGVIDSSSWTDEGGYEPRHATHWMPLPPPPGVDGGSVASPETDRDQERKDFTRVEPGATMPSAGSTAASGKGTQDDSAGTTARCRFCCEEIRYIDGAWLDRETHATCGHLGSLTHEPRTGSGS